MSKIQINTLQAPGSELFTGGESFLTELQATEAHSIFGGSSGKKNTKKKDKYAVAPVVIIPVPFPVPVPYPYNPCNPCGC